MTPVDEYRSWIEDTKPLLGAKAKKSLSENNAKLAALLKQFESAKIPGQGGFLNEYERLAARANDARAEKELAAVAKALAGLEKRMSAEKTSHDKWILQRDELIKNAAAKIVQESEKIRKAAQAKLGQNSASLDFLIKPIEDQLQLLDFDLKTLSPGDLLDTTKKAFTDRMSKVITDETATINSADFVKTAKVATEKQQAAKESDQKAALERELRELRGDVRRVLSTLEDVGVPAAQIDAFEQNIAKAAAKDELKRIETQIEMRRKSQVEVQATAAKKVKEQIESAKKLLEVKKTEFAKNKPALKSLEVLEKDLSNLDSLIGASHPDALKGAEMTCTRVKQILNATSATAGFGAILARITKQEELLKDDSLKKFHEDKVNQISLRITKLRDEGIDAFDLAPGDKEIGEIESEITSLVASEKALQGWRADIGRWLETTKHATRTVDEFINRPGLFQQLSARFKGKNSMIDVLTKDIAESYDKPGADTADINSKRAAAQGRIDDLLKLLKMQTTEKAAETQVGKVQERLDKEYADGAAELKARKDNKDAEKKDREDWEKELKEFNNAFSSKKKQVKAAKGPKADLQAIKGIYESAKKAGEKDLKAGRDQLAAANRRLDQLDPKGVSFDGPEDLPKTPERWANALTNFSANLDELAKRAGAKAQLVPLPAPAIADMKDKITRSKDLFNAKAFAGAPKLIDTSIPLSQRKKIREEVLLEIRRHKALLLNDPTLALIRRNPFKMPGSARDIRACLDSLELNALRAVPAK